jgi:hypothetical protein
MKNSKDNGLEMLSLFYKELKITYLKLTFSRLSKQIIKT